MKLWSRLACVLSMAACLAACGESAASDLTIERLPDVNPSLPDVPTLPPPPHETQYSDGSYSVYGVRRRGATTMDTDVEVTGYIVEIYEPPECPEDQTCDPPAAPHLWIADTRDAGEDDDRIMVAGYAENQAQIDEAIEQAETNRYEPPDPESGILPIPVNFREGTKVKIEGRFTRVSGAGFNVSSGLLDYRGHEILEPAEGQELLLVDEEEESD
ncbi:MAG TPA: hypothetical protein RMH99_31595 [Sandaracinaceae bacterium LLY-WYZ-13_1]|nr:hypothetical protein [Sandaracinaceae bacterium LLY-WYZ-13_1]